MVNFISLIQGIEFMYSSVIFLNSWNPFLSHDKPDHTFSFLDTDMVEYCIFLCYKCRGNKEAMAARNSIIRFYN